MLNPLTQSTCASEAVKSLLSQSLGIDLKDLKPNLPLTSQLRKRPPKSNVPVSYFSNSKSSLPPQSYKDLGNETFEEPRRQIGTNQSASDHQKRYRTDSGIPPVKKNAFGDEDDLDRLISDHELDVFSATDLSWSDQAPVLKKILNQPLPISDDPVCPDLTPLSLPKFFESLRLTAQHIRTIDTKFARFSNLTELSLTGNFLTSESLALGIPHLPPSIQILSLNGNMLTEVPDLAHLSLIHLGLAHNRISKISKSCLPKSLISLDLAWTDYEDVSELVLALKGFQLKVLVVIGTPVFLLPRCRKLLLTELKALMNLDEEGVTWAERESYKSEIGNEDRNIDEVSLSISVTETTCFVLPVPPLAEPSKSVTDVAKQAPPLSKIVEGDDEERGPKPADEFYYYIKVQLPVESADSDPNPALVTPFVLVPTVDVATAQVQSLNSSGICNKIEFDVSGKIRKATSPRLRDALQGGLVVSLCRKQVTFVPISSFFSEDGGERDTENAELMRPLLDANKDRKLTSAGIKAKPGLGGLAGLGGALQAGNKPGTSRDTLNTSRKPGGKSVKKVDDQAGYKPVVVAKMEIGRGIIDCSSLCEGQKEITTTLTLLTGDTTVGLTNLIIGLE